jgi:hypothetical protein
LGAKISLCYSVNDEGIVDPNRVDRRAVLWKPPDLMVSVLLVFGRYRQTASMITDFSRERTSNGWFRTATHTFMYKDNPEMQHSTMTWPTKAFTQQWITHHILKMVTHHWLS